MLDEGQSQVHQRIIRLLFYFVYCYYSPSTASSVAPSVKRVFNLDDHDDRGAPLTTVFEMESENSEVQSVAESDWWCRAVQHFEIHSDDDEPEVIDWSFEGYECHDLTMFDAYETEFEWMLDAQVRGVEQQNREQEQPWVDGSYHQIVLDSGADLSVMPRAWMALKTHRDRR